MVRSLAALKCLRPLIFVLSCHKRTKPYRRSLNGDYFLYVGDKLF